MVDDIFYRFFISVESGVPTLELEKYDFPQLSLRKSIEDDVVTALSSEDHVFRTIGKIWKCWEDLLIELSHDLVLRSYYGRSANMLVLEKRKYAHECHTEDESEECSGDESRDIHVFFLFSRTFLIISSYF